MFPIDMNTGDCARMMSQFDGTQRPDKIFLEQEEILPKSPEHAGEDAGVLTEEGVKLLDVSGNHQAGIPVLILTARLDATNKYYYQDVQAKCTCRNFMCCHGGFVHGLATLQETWHGLAMVHCNNWLQHQNLNAWVSLFKKENLPLF